MTGEGGGRHESGEELASIKQSACAAKYADAAEAVRVRTLGRCVIFGSLLRRLRSSELEGVSYGGIRRRACGRGGALVEAANWRGGCLGSHRRDEGKR